MTAVKAIRYHIVQYLQGVHKWRLDALFVTVRALLAGADLCLSSLGRAIGGSVSDKHSIKRVDRLLGNRLLHQEVPGIYGALARHILRGIREPLILVDWTDLGTNWQALTAAIAFRGRALPIYSEVHPARSDRKRTIHDSFLATLKSLVIPSECQPVIVTDSGFQNPWFKEVRRIGWEFVGRLSTTPLVRCSSEAFKDEIATSWNPVTDVMAAAGPVPEDLDVWTVAKSNPMQARLVIYKCKNKGRKGTAKRNRKGVHVGSSGFKKAAKRAKNPWVLATSIEDVPAQQIVNLYSARMQIEETFRDSKSHRFGWSLEDVQSKSAARLSALLLIAALGMLIVHTAGLAAYAKGLHRKMQANTIRHRAVLSIFTVGNYTLRTTRWRQYLTKRTLRQATAGLRACVRSHMRPTEVNYAI
jgi:hypothetical protein